MIIVGDIACPTPELALAFQETMYSNNHVFRGKPLIANLEGLVIDNFNTKSETPVLFNHSHCLDVLQECNTVAVGLANNHTLDLPSQLQFTFQNLQKRGIKYAGAGHTRSESNEFIEFKIEGKDIILFNSCWDFLLYHQKNPSSNVFVATLDEIPLLESVKQLHRERPDSLIVVYLHWSFDLEILPFPMYRQFSRALIDAGVRIVAGCHSHCVQGGETYKDGYIVYGLGNFFLPYLVFANGKLNFPEFARIQLAFELNLITGQAYCHWFRYENNPIHRLQHVRSEEFVDSQLLSLYSPYLKMTDEMYLSYYMKNRRKKVLIPVFKNYKQVRINNLFTNILKTRAIVARKLAKLKIIDWQN